MNAALGARRLLRRCRNVALATHARRFLGYPYASLVPLVLDHDASPILLISRLAEHTRNVQADERVSIVAHAPDADVQAASRLTLLGACRRAQERAQLAERYLRYFPAAAPLLELDFDFYRITAAAVRYIGGFGSVHWLAPESIEPPPNALQASEPSVLEYVNGNHAQELRDCCHRVHAIAAREVSVIGLDCDGFDARADGALVRFDFAEPVLDAESARCAIIALFSAGRP
jgi:putative heme iron utilization protein